MTENTMTINKEFPLEVRYTFYPACQGARDSLGGVRGAGPPLEPDEPASVEIDDVILLGHSVIEDMSDSDIEELTLDVWQRHIDNNPDLPEPDPMDGYTEGM